MAISRPRLSMCSCVPKGPCSQLSSVIASVQVNGPMQLLIASLLTVPSSRGGALAYEAIST